MKKSTLKMPKQTFVPVGDYLPGAISTDPSIPLGLRRVRLELWQEWHRYNRIKLAAALDGDISRKRDARVQSIYARRGDTDGYKVKIATAEIRAINERLSEYHAVILDHAKVDEATALLSDFKPGKHKPFKGWTLKKSRAMAGKGFTNSYNHDGVVVTLTRENYKWPMSKLVAERIAHDEAHEVKFAMLGKCQCPSHTDTLGKGEFSKARKQKRG